MLLFFTVNFFSDLLCVEIIRIRMVNHIEDLKTSLGICKKGSKFNPIKFEAKGVFYFEEPGYFLCKRSD